VETLPIMQSGSNDAWKDFLFVYVTTSSLAQILPYRHFRIIRTLRENRDPEFKLVVKSEYILKACKDVIQTWPGISWNSDPLEVRISACACSNTP